jgi:aldehyde:ferredoxin oxidoreductase
MQNLGIIQDSLGICRFTGFAFSTEPWARMVSGLTGADFSTAHLEEIAERVATLERLFNLRAGFAAEDDTLPDRFVEETIPVEDRDRNIPREAMARMRSDYYSVRGWAEDSGLPLPETLETLNLKEDEP